MTYLALGKTLVIANPTSRSGQGKAGAEYIQNYLAEQAISSKDITIHLTQYAGEAVDVAAHAAGYDSVIALGGDGIIHEVVNGLMQIDRCQRPTLGLIPFGSGNDYARTLGMSLNNPEASLKEVLAANKRSVELGQVNGLYFMQTLSFGLDAAVAIDTTHKRANNTKQTGEDLFFKSGVKILSSAQGGWKSRVVIDGERPLDLHTLIFAINVGPSYGGGFRITPDANPADGYLNLCYNSKKASVPHVLFLFGLVIKARHHMSRILHLRRAKSIVLDFEEAIPCQADGEEILGRHFEVCVVPDALDVYVGTKLNW